MENGCVESFNGRLRDECLNENWFGDLAEARETIEAWRQDYNQFRLQSALGYRTPEEFAKSAARRLWKRRRKSRLGQCFAFPTFPQPRRLRTSTYECYARNPNPGESLIIPGLKTGGRSDGLLT
jgi:hypothetical protein